MKGFDWIVSLSLVASLLSARVDIQFVLDIAKQVFVVFPKNFKAGFYCGMKAILN